MNWAGRRLPMSAADSIASATALPMPSTDAVYRCT
jgi:hypothetical protein